MVAHEKSTKVPGDIARGTQEAGEPAQEDPSTIPGADFAARQSFADPVQKEGTESLPPDKLQEEE